MLDFEGLEVPEEVQKTLNERVSSLIAESVEKEVGGLKGKVDELLTEKKQFQAKAEEEKAAALKAAEDAARKAGDVEAIDKNWGIKYNKLEEEYKQKNSNYENTIRSLTVNQTAVKLAAELGGENAEALMPHIAPRLDVDLESGELKVLDSTGGLTPLTIDELKEDLKAKAYLAPLIVASNASGGSAGGNKAGARGASHNLTPAQDLAQRINKKFGK